MRRASLVVCVVVLLAACGAEEPVFTDPGASFEVQPGDRFTIVLESNASTGFSWVLQQPLDTDVVTEVENVYVDPDTDLVGAPGRQEITFAAVGDGSTFIQLWYIRSFDDPPEPADHAQFEVIVGSGDSGEPVDPADVDEPVSSIPDDEDAISVPELLETTPDGDVVVRGLLFDDGSGLRLCEMLAESFPPQCAGATVAIANPDDVDADFTVEGDVRWTDRVVVLLGRLDGETFTVTG